MAQQHAIYFFARLYPLDHVFFVVLLPVLLSACALLRAVVVLGFVLSGALIVLGCCWVVLGFGCGGADDYDHTRRTGLMVLDGTVRTQDCQDTPS